MEVHEGELIRRCQDGDRTSFDVLVRTYHALAYNVAYRMLNDPDAASDATQTAFVRAYRSIGSFRRDATFSTWLYRIVTNACLDRLRRKDRTSRSLSLVGDDGDGNPEDIDIPDSSHDPSDVAEQAERQAIVQGAISRLAPSHRAVLVLYDLSGLSYEQVAEALQVPLGTVKSRLNRARLALKEELAPHRELLR